MHKKIANSIISEICDGIDIPDSAYRLAEGRYKDLGEWFQRHDSSCALFNPRVFPQGSFRLGTVIRPLDANADYDLDIVCKLENKISKSTHSQKMLKNIIGNEVEKYRSFRQIQEEKEEKRRCWRLHYKDQLTFHLDILPCIPEEIAKINHLKAAMVYKGSSDSLAQIISELTVAITDTESLFYGTISNNWNISNPEGYALWFESKMKLAEDLLKERLRIEKALKIDDLPAYKWKTPLQQAVQILKRHRDMMFLNEPQEIKPISIIITTLSAEAYQGELELADALRNMLKRMLELASCQKPGIPNPVNPDENFADKWTTEEGKKLNLEKNFRRWLIQAQADFDIIESTDDIPFIEEQVKKRYGVTIDSNSLKEKLGISAPSMIVKPENHEISQPTPKPWCKKS